MTYDMPETCKVCGMKMRNIGIFQNPMWHCFRCEERFDAVGRTTDEDTKPLFEDWPEITPTPRASDRNDVAALGTGANCSLQRSSSAPRAPEGSQPVEKRDGYQALAHGNQVQQTPPQPESAPLGTSSTPSRPDCR